MENTFHDAPPSKLANTFNFKIEHLKVHLHGIPCDTYSGLLPLLMLFEIGVCVISNILSLYGRQ